MASSDLELLARYVKTREAEAFAEVVARHRDMVYGTCYRLLGNRPDAEDAAQECFLQLARSGSTVRRSVAGWLHRVAVRSSLALRRKDRARQRAEREAGSMAPDRVAEPTWEDIKAEVDRAIDRLPDDLREPLVLHFLQGRPQTDVAEALGVSQPAVSMRITKAVERLRRQLGPTGTALSVAGLVALLEAHSAEAAPATLIANLGRVALAGLGPSPPAGLAASVLGHAASMTAATKTVCLLAVCVAVGSVVQQTIQQRSAAAHSPGVGAAVATAQSLRANTAPGLSTPPPGESKLRQARASSGGKTVPLGTPTPRPGLASDRGPQAPTVAGRAGDGPPPRVEPPRPRVVSAPTPQTRGGAASGPLLAASPGAKGGPPVRLAQATPAAPPQAKTVPLKGRVLGPDGKPFAGAEVGVIDPAKGGGATLEGLFIGKCSATGEFELAVVDVSTWGGWRPPYGVLARSGDGTLMGGATIAGGDVAKPIEVRLRTAGYIHTSVLSPEARPLPDIGTWIGIRDAGAAVQGPHTNDRGEVRVGPLPAGLQLRLVVAFELEHLVPQNVWDRKEITLHPGETYELAPLTLDPQGRSIEGVLEDADGKPLAGAKVACYLPSWPVNAATADEQGRFKLTRLPVRGYDVWLIAADTAKQLYIMAPVDPDSGEKVRLVLRPLTSAGGFLSGPEGQVLAGVQVRIFPTLRARREGVTSYTMWNTQWVSVPQPVKTAADGAWQVKGLVAGGMYSWQPEMPDARLNFEKGLFEVDRQGKPTDLGLMTVP